MASAVIHMAVANEINKIVKYDNDKILIGSIAPDISKLIGENKLKSHFLDSIENDIPNMDRFLIKYKKNLSDPFVMGYYIHLYTDYLWFKYFIPNFYSNQMITKLDGSVVKCNERMLDMYIYNDYTNLNVSLLDEYKMNLKIFYNEIPAIERIITEIPMDKIDIIVDKIGLIIENTKVNKNFVFDISNIKEFIDLCVESIVDNLKELSVIK